VKKLYARVVYIFRTLASAGKAGETPAPRTLIENQKPIPMPKQDLGLDAKPLRPLDKSAMSNDNATLRALVAQLNDPRVTGAEVPKDEKYDAPSGAGGATIIAPATPVEQDKPAPVVATPAPAGVQAPAPRISMRLFFTGRGVSDIVRAIGAIEYNIAKPVTDLASKLFPAIVFADDSNLTKAFAPGVESFLLTLKAWGSGEVSPAFPITPARAIFIKMIHSMYGAPGALPLGIDWAKFGTDEGFWIDSCINAAKAQVDSDPGVRVVVTGLTSEHEFKYIQAQGFSHWHSMARPGIGGVVDSLSNALDNSVTRQISTARNGTKLHCIWKDTTAPTSSRLWSLADFTSAAAVSQLSASVNVALE
jgi:hypothetical protein